MKQLSKIILAGVAAGLFCYVQMAEAWASPVEPKEPPKEIKYILGYYYGNGENIIVRENNGELDLLYRVWPEDADFSRANIFPLLKVRFDSYNINESGPVGAGESDVYFNRDRDGYGIALRVGGHTYTRRFLSDSEGDKGQPMRLPQIAPEEWSRLRTEAVSAVVPVKLQEGTVAELVNANTVEGLKINSVYSTKDNLFGAPLYETKDLFIAKEVAVALGKVQQQLSVYGYGLVLWDAYRPWYISRLANLALPKNSKGMLEDPLKEGSPHNTGMSVDVGLYSLETGEEVPMISGFDEPSFRQYSKYPGGSTKERFLRELLRNTMKLYGFTGIDMEWWHFTFDEKTKYAHQNLDMTKEILK